MNKFKIKKETTEHLAGMQLIDPNSGEVRLVSFSKADIDSTAEVYRQHNGELSGDTALFQYFIFIDCPVMLTFISVIDNIENTVENLVVDEAFEKRCIQGISLPEIDSDASEIFTSYCGCRVMYTFDVVSYPGAKKSQVTFHFFDKRLKDSVANRFDSSWLMDTESFKQQFLILKIQTLAADIDKLKEIVGR